MKLLFFYLTLKSANWAYTAQGDDELSFEEGDVIYVSDQSSEWWRATCKGKSGLVPGNYLIESDGNSSQIDFPLQEAAKRGNLEWVSPRSFKPSRCRDSKFK